MIQQDLQNILKEYTTIQSRTPQSVVGQLTPTEGKHTFKQPLPMTSPSGNSGIVMVTPYEAEEDKADKKISKAKLSEFVKDELHKASMYGMDYAVMILSELQSRFKLE